MTDDATLTRVEAHMQRGNELLARIDEHLERGIKDFSPEQLARGAEFEERLERHLARCEEVIAAQSLAYDGWRFSMRQDSLRNERVLGEISQTLARHTDELTRHTDEMIAEQRARRAALWKMLDRLAGEDGPGPADG